ncbi:MAG: alpha/beta hydrolase [Candidatus Pacebacteria bacterium]|nr:alpha/beta hydrolase [Candidatus Paceibacterota bacterium]
MKRVFIVHGWASSPEDAWFPWLKTEVEQRGYAAFALTLPEPKRPHPEAWLTAIERAVGEVDSDTFFVAHSLGCRATALFLEGRSAHEVAGGAVLVAGSFLAPKEPHPHPLAQEVRVRWGSLTPHPQMLLSHVRHITAIYSEDDPWVSFDNAAYARDVLSAKLIVEHNKGHFRGKHDGVLELPSARDALFAQIDQI